MSINAIAPAGTQTGPFWVGDTALTSVFELDRDGEAVTGFTGASVKLTDPFGVVDTLTGVATVTDSTATVAWPNGTFDAPGLWTLQLVLTGTGKIERANQVPFVVEDDSEWHTLDSARREWTTGAPSDSVLLYNLLVSARLAVQAYAPELALDERVPLNYRQAQIMQARNTMNAAKTDPQQAMDGEMFVIRPYPLDNTIKQLLRPKRVLGSVA